MKKRTIAFVGAKLEYTIRRNTRAKRTSITIHPNGNITVTLTPMALERTAERFVQQKQDWILKSLLKIKKEESIFLPKVKKSEIETLRKIARKLIKERVYILNSIYSFSFNRVFIKNHRKQWGSCSEKKNLNFNIQLIHLPAHLRDMVIVHELCHLKYLNHSKAFWQEVKKGIPLYQRYEKELKRYIIA